jgi:protein O-mannosyl-transferase
MPVKSQTRKKNTVHQPAPPMAVIPEQVSHAEDATGRGRWQPLVPCVALVALTLVVWIRVLGNPFINYDDPLYITENTNIRALNWKTVSWAFTALYEGNWHPLTWLSHALDYQLFGLNPLGHHLTSLVLHVFNVVVLYLLLYGATKKAGRSFCVAALFAIHPLNVESVAWVAERKNVLCTLFFLLALAAYGWYVRKPNVTRYFLVIAAFALGLASKPMVITLPCLLLLLDVWPLRRIRFQPQSSGTSKQQRRIDFETRRGEIPLPIVSFSKAILEKLPLLVFSAASAIVTIYAQRTAMPSTEALTLAVRFENAVHAYSMYIWKAFFPIGLAPIYPHPGNSLTFLQVSVAALFLILASFGVWMKRETAPFLWVGWLWYLGSLVPVIGIVQVGKQAMADRYAYIPLIGIMVMVVWTVADLLEGSSNGRRWQTAVAAIFLITFSYLTWRQLGFWHTKVGLWAHTLAVTRDNDVAEANMGGALVEAGRFDDALPHFRNVLRMDPENATSLVDLAAEMQQKADLHGAINFYEEALVASTDPKLRAGVYVNLWTIYTELDNFAIAQTNLEQALAIDPKISQALIPSFAQTVSARPSAQGCLQLGELFQRAGHPDQAQSAYNCALTLKPDYSEARKMLEQLGNQAK